MQRGLATCLLLCATSLPACTVQAPTAPTETAAVTSSAERDCLVRAMYFESNRSSHDGLMAVGTVVMNRVSSPQYPNTICAVVAQPRQFAPGVMTKAMNEAELPAVRRAADAVLSGERYQPVGNAMHFHVAGLNIPYQVRYVTVAGGNAFYVRPGARSSAPAAKPVVVASVKPETVEAATASPPATLFDQFYASLTAPQATAAAKPCGGPKATFAPAFACQ